MREYDETLPLISLHIPKCGGTSVNRVLFHWFKWNYRKHYVDEKRNRTPKKHNIYSRFSKTGFKKKFCIHGHFNRDRGTGVKDYYPDVEQFITFLRDPFEVCLSNFFFAKRLGLKAYWGGKPHYAADPTYDISRYLKNASSFILKFFPVEISWDNYKEIIESYFIYIGIMEDLQGSIDRLSSRLNFDSVIVPKLNTSNRYGEIPEGAKEIFLENNRLEYAVYQYAVQLQNLR